MIYPADQEQIDQAARLIASGGVVAFPTETVYGLGANALDSHAVQQIFQIKGRPASNPLIVHVAGIEQARELTQHWPDTAELLCRKFWPGPLTLVCHKSERVPAEVTAGGGTVAIRMPAHPIARELIRLAGVPIAAPSANKSGELSPTTASHVAESLGERVSIILDGGPCTGGLESTVVDCTQSPVRLLRPGLIDRTQLEQVVGKIIVDADNDNVVSRSPGLLSRHYSPRTALECGETEAETEHLVQLYETAGLKVATYSLNPDPDRASASLYADLHALDRLGYDRIIVTMPEDAEAWRTIRDRLARASAESD